MFFTKIKVWFASKWVVVRGFFVKLGKAIKAFFDLSSKLKGMKKIVDKPIRIEREFAPNPDSCAFHVSEMITRKTIMMFSDPDSSIDEKTPMSQDLFRIKGVKQIFIEPYEVHVIKGHAFTWKELAPKIESVLRKHVTSSSKLHLA